MVKVCEVPGCETGRYKDRTQRRALGLRQRALFRTPKCNNRLAEWKRALNCNLDIGKVVCELHFDEKHIKKYNKTVLSNGDVHVMPLIVWHLTDDAIPMSRSQDCAPNVDCANEADRGDSRASTLERETHHRHTTSDDTVSSVIPLRLAAEESVATKSTMNSTVFTMDMLQTELSATVLPESWAWTRQLSKTIFTLLDSSSLCPKLHLDIAPDLSLEIRTNMGVSIPLDVNVESIADTLAYLKILKKIPICSGTGIDSETRHRNCAGILEDEKIYKRRQQTPRCMLCRQLRHELQRRIHRSRGGGSQERLHAMLMAELTRRKFLRLQRKAKKLL